MHTITFEVPKIAENPKLRAIVEASARNLVSLAADQESDILRALQEADEGKATLSHAIKIDLNKSKQTDSLSFSIKHGDEITQALPDPDQPDLFSGMRTAGQAGEASEAPALPDSSGPLMIEAEVIEDEEFKPDDITASERVAMIFDMIKAEPHPLKRGGLIEQVAKQFGGEGLDGLERLLEESTVKASLHKSIMKRIDDARVALDVAPADDDPMPEADADTPQPEPEGDDY